MLTLNQKIHPNDEVIDTDLGEGEIALLHTESQNCYRLNFTGARIWQYLKQGLTLQEISHRLCEEFDVDAESVDSCVLKLIEGLSRLKLVRIRAY